MTLIYAALIGIVVGIIVGALGAGGGIISVPVLVYILGQGPHEAAAASLVIVGLTALVSLLPRIRSNVVHWKDGFIFGLLCVVGSVVGSRLNAIVDGHVLMISFGILLLCVSVLMAMKATGRGFLSRQSSASGGKQGGGRGLPALLLAATATGLLTGFFGVGGGFAVVPILVLLMRFGMREAAATSLVVMIVLSVSGLVSRIGTDIHVDWGVTLVFAAASMIGGLAGGPLTKNVHEKVLTAIFAALLFIVGIASLVAGH